MSSLPDFKWEEHLSNQALSYLDGMEIAGSGGQSVPMTEGHIAAMKFAYQASLLKGSHNFMSRNDSFRIMDYTAGVPLLFQFDGERTGPYPQEGTPLIYYGTVSEVKKKVQAQVLTITRTNNLDEDSLKRQILMHIVDGTARVELTNFIESWEATVSVEESDDSSTGRETTERWEALEGLDIDYLDSLTPKPARVRIVIREGGEETKTSEPATRTEMRSTPSAGTDLRAPITTRSKKKQKTSDTRDSHQESPEAHGAAERIVVSQDIEERMTDEEYALVEAEWMRKRAELMADSIRALRAKYREELASGECIERGGVILRKRLIRSSTSSPTSATSKSTSKKKSECTYETICEFLAATYQELDGQAIRDLDQRIREFPPWDGSVTPIARLSALKMLMIRLEKVQSVEAVQAKFTGADVYKLYRAGFTTEFELSLANFMGKTMDTMTYTEVLNTLHRCLISISKMNPYFYQVIMNHVSTRKGTKAANQLPHKAPILNMPSTQMPTNAGAEQSSMPSLQDQLQRLESKMESHFAAIAGGAVQQARQQDKKNGQKYEDNRKRKGGKIDVEMVKKKISDALGGRMDLQRKDVLLCYRCNYFRPRTHIQQGCYVATKSEVTAEKAPHNSYPLTDQAYQNLVKEEELNQKLFKSTHSGMTPKEFFRQQSKEKQAVNSRGGR